MSCSGEGRCEPHVWLGHPPPCPQEPQRWNQGVGAGVGIALLLGWGLGRPSSIYSFWPKVRPAEVLFSTQLMGLGLRCTREAFLPHISCKAPPGRVLTDTKSLPCPSAAGEIPHNPAKPSTPSHLPQFPQLQVSFALRAAAITSGHPHGHRQRPKHRGHLRTPSTTHPGCSKDGVFSSYQIKDEPSLVRHGQGRGQEQQGEEEADLQRARHGGLVQGSAAGGRALYSRRLRQLTQPLLSQPTCPGCRGGTAMPSLPGVRCQRRWRHGTEVGTMRPVPRWPSRRGDAPLPYRSSFGQSRCGITALGFPRWDQSCPLSSALSPGELG